MDSGGRLLTSILGTSYLRHPPTHPPYQPNLRPYSSSFKPSSLPLLTHPPTSL